MQAAPWLCFYTTFRELPQQLAMSSWANNQSNCL
jgi:hypothetical protein